MTPRAPSRAGSRVAVCVALLATAAARAGDPGPFDCPWDCGQPPDKDVGIADFLAVIGTWGIVGVPCDFDGGGVGINDFLALIGNWGPCPAPGNDECVGAVAIDLVDPQATILEPFDMLGATPSAEDHQCLGEPNTHKDLWYCLNNGTGATILVTLATDVAVAIEATEGCVCPPGPTIACAADGQAGLALTLQPDEQAGIRLLNAVDLPNDQLAGTLTVENAPIGACCLADKTCVQTSEAECTAQTATYRGDNVPCDPDPCGPIGACCFPDATCSDAVTLAQCEAAGGSYLGDDTLCADVECPPGCGDPDAGDCCSATGTPGCADFDCCQAICAFDVFCCDMEWDAFCAEEALQFSTECGCLQICGPGKTPENEPDCGAPVDTVNGGCTASPPVFSSISCGEAVCGTVRSGAASRDTDWYRVILSEPRRLTWTVTAGFPVQTGLLQYFSGFEGSGNCSHLTGQLAPGALGAPGQTISITTPCLPAGIWYLFVAPISGTSVACGAEYNAELTDCQEFCESCGSPVNGACCFANFTPGCEDIVCCRAVCDTDPFCCDVSWDTICGQLAGLEPACGCGGLP